MYKCVYFSAYGYNKDHVYRSNISIEDVKEIERNIETINKLLSVADYYLMVRDNCFDFLNDCHHNGPGNDKTFIRANRLFLNALNSYYVWQEYSEQHPINPRHRDIIRKIKNRGVLELANRIRHNGVHNNTPITESTYDSIKEHSTFTISINELFTEKEQNGFNKKIKHYLSGIDKLEATSFIMDFLNEFNSLNKDVWKELEENYLESIRFLQAYVPDNPPDCYNSVILNDEEDDYINIGRTLELVTIKYKLINESNKYVY